MKRILSIILALVTVTGILLAFPVSSLAYEPPYEGPYSGGSGTEDDPYLIGKTYDILKLFDNIEEDPALYGNKKYYRLTKDLDLSSYKTVASPLMDTIFSGRICYMDTGLTLNDVYKASKEDYTDYTEWFEETTARLGPLYTRFQENDFRHGPTGEKYEGFENDAEALYERAVLWICRETTEDYIYDMRLYRKAAFTGVFDGNGHTVTLSNNYLFGYLENGAEIKNLKLDGENASLAYCVSESSKISDCMINAESNCTYLNTGYSATFDYYREEYRYNYTVYGGVVAINYGTLENIVNYSRGICGIVGYDHSHGTVRNCANYGKVVADGSGLSLEGNLDEFLAWNEWTEDPEYDYINSVMKPKPKGINGGIFCIDYANNGSSVSGDGYFFANECKNAEGNVNVYLDEGFDFENAWMMLNGYPVLRWACRAMAGDLNIDGAVNGSDSNLMKRYISGDVGAGAFVFLGGADLNLDGIINSADSYQLKKMLVGQK